MKIPLFDFDSSSKARKRREQEKPEHNAKEMDESLAANLLAETLERKTKDIEDSLLAHLLEGIGIGARRHPQAEVQSIP